MKIHFKVLGLLGTPSDLNVYSSTLFVFISKVAVNEFQSVKSNGLNSDLIAISAKLFYFL